MVRCAMARNDRYSLMIHGGAGALDNVSDNKTAVRYLDAIRGVLEHGREVLALGGSAVQAVEGGCKLADLGGREEGCVCEDGHGFWLL